MATGGKKTCWACTSQNTGTSRKPPDHQAPRSRQSQQSGGFQANSTPKIMSLLIITLFYDLSIFNKLCKKFRHSRAAAKVKAARTRPYLQHRKTPYPPAPCRHDLVRHSTTAPPHPDRPSAPEGANLPEGPPSMQRPFWERSLSPLSQHRMQLRHSILLSIVNRPTQPQFLILGVVFVTRQRTTEEASAR